MRSHFITFVILGVFTFLAFPGLCDADVINACKNNRNGALRVVDDVADCRTSETQLSWNTEGPQGEQGEPGTPGPPGPTGGLDVSRLYVVTCNEEFQCQCEDRGGRHFISATVNCGLCDNNTQASLYTTAYLQEPDFPPDTFEAFCNCADYTEGRAQYTVPLSIQLICYDNSE
jgi:hypothetical protein